MANLTGKGGVRFGQGQPINTSGRPKEDPAIRKFKEMTYQEFIDKLQEFGALTNDQLKDVVKSKDTPVFHLIFARVLFEAQKGDLKAIQMLFDRLWGKVKDSDIDFEKLKNAAAQVVITLPDNGRSAKPVNQVEDK